MSFPENIEREQEVRGLRAIVFYDESGGEFGPPRRDMDNLTVMQFCRDIDYDLSDKDVGDLPSSYSGTYTLDCGACEGSGYPDGEDGAPCGVCEGTGEVEGNVVDYVAQDDDVLLAVGLRFSDYGSGGATVHTTDDDDDANGVCYVTKKSLALTGAPMDENGATDLRTGIEQDVKVMDSYLRGEFYGWAVMDYEGNLFDACHGFIGDADIPYALSEAVANAEYHADLREREAVEAAYWLDRGVVTV